VLKDNKRWKIDPTQNKKLSAAIDMEQVVRFECIFDR
jgi:hypothetical protein